MLTCSAWVRSTYFCHHHGKVEAKQMTPCRFPQKVQFCGTSSEQHAVALPKSRSLHKNGSSFHFSPNQFNMSTHTCSSVNVFLCLTWVWDLSKVQIL